MFEVRTISVDAGSAGINTNLESIMLLTAIILEAHYSACCQKKHLVEEAVVRFLQKRKWACKFIFTSNLNILITFLFKIAVEMLILINSDFFLEWSETFPADKIANFARHHFKWINLSWSPLYFCKFCIKKKARQFSKNPVAVGIANVASDLGDVDYA